MSKAREIIKEIQDAPIELKNAKSKLDTDREATITHYLHNSENGVGKAYKKEAVEYTKEILKQNYPDVTFTNEVAEEFLEYRLFKMDDVPFPAPQKAEFTFIDLFAGIGGFRMGLQNLGGKCVFSSEWNTYSKKTYDANYGEVPFGDITKVKEHNVPDHDILVGGFPCQPFSIAGVSKKNALGRAHGFKDETQGTLFFDIVRILEAKRPKAFLLENVKNLVSHDKGHTFEVIQGALKEIGYNVHKKVLDGKHFVPQHRERIILVGFDEKVFKGKEKFSFPEMPPADKAIKDILEKNVDPKYTLSDKLWNYLQDYANKHKLKGNGFGFGLTDLNGISRTISARYYKDGAEILIPQKGKNPRRLTPRECARLQGYPDNFVIPVSDTQAYKQFGNSIVVPLMEAVSENIVKVITRNTKN